MDKSDECGVMVHTRGEAMGFPAGSGAVYCANPKPCKMHCQNCIECGELVSEENKAKNCHDYCRLEL